MVNRRREAGTALLLAIMVVFLVATAVMMVGQHLQTGFSEFHSEKRQVNLIALTDAALAETLAGLAVNPDFTGVATHAFGTGTISSTVAARAPGLVQVTAQATYAGWQGSLVAEVSLAGPQVLHWSRRRHRPS